MVGITPKTASGPGTPQPLELPRFIMNCWAAEQKEEHQVRDVIGVSYPGANSLCQVCT